MLRNSVHSIKQKNLMLKNCAIYQLFIILSVRCRQGHAYSGHTDKKFFDFTFSDAWHMVCSITTK